MHGKGLTLTRRNGEGLQIGENVFVRVYRAGNRIKVCVKAPQDQQIRWDHMNQPGAARTHAHDTDVAPD